MIFAVDIGNSNIVIGLLDENRNVVFSGRIRTDRQKTKEEFMIELKTLLDIYSVKAEGVRGVIISSVVPVLTDVVREGMALLTGRTPMVVGHGIKTGIKIATDHPASLGTDLVVDAVGAVEEYPGPLVIFDLGTATTCSGCSKPACPGFLPVPFPYWKTTSISGGSGGASGNRNGPGTPTAFPGKYPPNPRKGWSISAACAAASSGLWRRCSDVCRGL